MDTRTLIATFNDYSAANQAARELESSGISTDAVNIDSDRKTAGAGSSGGYHSSEQHTGFSGWWNSLFGSDTDDQERRGYESALAEGGAVLRATVPAQSVDTAAEILNRNGAVDIDRRGQSTDPERRSDTETRTGTAGPVQVVEEQLQIGKRAVRRGGVRIYSHVVTQPVEEQIRLREEHVNVERRPVDREISPGDLAALRDQTIEVTEMAEEPVIAKRARVREEVIVGKESTERTETVRDSVRHTEVEVEQLGRETGSAGDSQRTASSSGKIKATGLSPTPPAPSVMSGFGSTAGTGTLAGDATAGSAARNLDVGDFTPEYRKNFEQTYGTSSDFEAMRPAYEYGYRSASDKRYSGKSWSQVENDLRADYERTNPGSTWEKTKDAVRYGWEKVTGHR